jgi:hypothetical protein
MTKKYCLIDGAVVEEPDLLRWRRWMEDARQRGALQIGHTVIRKMEISTIFVGEDGRGVEDGAGPPLVFELVVFQLADGERVRVAREVRLSTLEEARAEHAFHVRLIDPANFPRLPEEDQEDAPIDDSERLTSAQLAAWIEADIAEMDGPGTRH